MSDVFFCKSCGLRTAAPGACKSCDPAGVDPYSEPKAAPPAPPKDEKPAAPAPKK